MTLDDVFDPLRPMLYITDGLRTGTLTEVDPGILPLLRTHRLLTGANPFAAILRQDLRSLCDRIDVLVGTVPEPSMLAAGARIDGWCGALVDDLPVLVGVVTGHPRLRHGARCITSPLVRIEPDKGWARTFSRYYRLGRPDRSCLTDLLAEGRLRSDTRAFDIPTSGVWS